MDGVFQVDAAHPEFAEWVVRHRRALHQIPEMSYEEELTSAYIREQLTALGIEYRHPLARHGIIADLGPPGSASGAPLVGLRADMDALPVEEPPGLEFRSAHPGRMHACGHDAHMAMLLGAAKLLKAREAQLPGRVRLVFQPAEERFGGAKGMIEDGALEGVGAMFGVHVWPGLPSGTVSTKAGAVMAASAGFSAVIVGRGGHAAMPHLAIDPVVAAAAAVGQLQALVSRETSPTDSGVVSVTRFNTGAGALNVIPDSVELQGTVRALALDLHTRLRRRVDEVLQGVAQLHGCRVANLTWSEVPYPPTVNHPGAAALAAAVAGRLAAAAAAVAAGGGGGGGGGGEEGAEGVAAAGYVPLEQPSLAGEDFSFYTQQVPSSFIFLGISSPEKGTNVSLHNPGFKLDEDVLSLGAALHASIAVEALQQLAAAGGQLGAGGSGAGAGGGACQCAAAGGGGGRGACAAAAEPAAQA